MPGTRFTLEVQPQLPPRLERLRELANDLVYSWDRQVRSLFWRLDPELWDRCGHNPKVFLRRVAQDDPSPDEEVDRRVDGDSPPCAERGVAELQPHRLPGAERGPSEGGREPAPVAVGRSGQRHCRQSEGRHDDQSRRAP